MYEPDNDLHGMTCREWGQVTTKEVLAGLEEAIRRVQDDLKAALGSVGEMVKDAEARVTDISGTCVTIELDDELADDLDDTLGTAADHADELEKLLAPTADDTVGADDNA
jgi:hypothetical protein